METDWESESEREREGARYAARDGARKREGAHEKERVCVQKRPRACVRERQAWATPKWKKYIALNAESYETQNNQIYSREADANPNMGFSFGQHIFRDQLTCVVRRLAKTHFPNECIVRRFDSYSEWLFFRRVYAFSMQKEEGTVVRVVGYNKRRDLKGVEREGQYLPTSAEKRIQIPTIHQTCPTSFSWLPPSSLSLSHTRTHTLILTTCDTSTYGSCVIF